MASRGWSCRGRIFHNASRIYYVPDEPSLPPLRWMAEKQQFEYLRSANSEDVELRATITNLAHACSQLYHPQSIQQPSIAASLSCYIPCEALYGVLPLGSVNAALLYVTAKEFVCAVTVGGATHDVYAVRGLQWLHLPCVTSSAVSQRRQRRQGESRHPRSRRGAPSETGEAGNDRGNAATPEEARHGRAELNRGEEEDAEDEDEDEDDNAASSTNTEDDDDVSEEVGRLPSKTVNDYLAVLNRFCESVNTHYDDHHDGNHDCRERDVERELPGISGAAGRFSYFYFSPTLDLSADPVHLLGLLTGTPHPGHCLCSAAQGEVKESLVSSTLGLEGCDNGDACTEPADAQAHTRRGNLGASGQHAWEDTRAAATTRQLYQWNSPLLFDGFALPTMAALQNEFDVTCQQANPEKTALPWRSVCAEEVQRHARTLRRTDGAQLCTLPAMASPPFSSTPLYIPAFIRGLVAQASASSRSDMTLITRTCCRWAGTRYNRRGLEPGHSGVVANMSMASLWVTANVAESQSAALKSTPFAVYTVMRGSVPRRWEQPANLALKPPIKISPVSNAAEELGRHVRLLKRCMPELHALFCLDTMSHSKLEEPLSEAFAAAVRRYVEGTPKATSPATSVDLEEKDGAHLSAENSAAAVASGGNVNGGTAPEHDLSVTLVRFNVKKELKKHHYEDMMRRCLAEMDGAAGGNSWLDFTMGHARCTEDDEARRMENVLGTSQPLGAWPSSKACGGAAVSASQMSPSQRICFDHVQSRLVRVNCLDCLDRTNLVQSILLCAVLPRMMAYVEGTAGVASETAATTLDRVDVALRSPAYAAASHRLRVLLAAQGTAISQLYAGTEPHFVPYMLRGHHHWSHKAVEGVLAQRRWYQQNFFDGAKQDGVALITRQHNPQVFNADIESPFSRDLSGMNRQVMYGLLLGILPFLYSFMVCASEHRFASSAFQLHLAICLGWVVYLSVLYNKLMRYRVTYTNRPLLLYTRQTEWC